MATDPEHGRQLFAYLRHLDTLSTGAVILQIGFLEKIFPHPKWKALVAVSLISFTVSIVASVVAQTATLGRFSRYSWVWADRGFSISCFALFTVWLGFMSGLTTLMTFALKNLFTL